MERTKLGFIIGIIALGSMVGIFMPMYFISDARHDSMSNNYVDLFYDHQALESNYSQLLNDYQIKLNEISLDFYKISLEIIEILHFKY